MKRNASASFVDNGKYKIYKNVPVPEPANTFVFRALFEEMKVGDSILINGMKERIRLGNASQKFGKKNPGFKFAIRKESADQWRMWRIPA